MRNKWSTSLIIVLVLISLSVFLLGFNKMDNNVSYKIFNVYLDGKIIGSIEDQDEFSKYINQKEEEIKNKYKVDTVYPPNGVEIKEEITYQPKIKTNEQIYNEIIKQKKFTVKGVQITIKNEEKDLKMYVLSKDIFDKALTNTMKAFINVDEYNDYITSNQKEITETGSIIENIDVKEKITYKETLISTEEKIFTDVDEVAKYLLYGTTENQIGRAHV